MTSHRKSAMAVGMLFVTCTAAAIAGGALSIPLLAEPDYLAKLSAEEGRIVTAAFLELVWAVTGAGIAVGLYPVLRRWGRALALGAVCLRVAEGIAVVVAALGLLTLLTLSREFVASGASAASPLAGAGALILAARGWVNDVIALVPFALGAMMYYYLLFRSNLVPRWLSAWGGVAAALSLGVTLYTAYDRSFADATMHTILNLPIGINEMVLAVWLIIRGFSPLQPEPAAAPAAVANV